MWSMGVAEIVSVISAIIYFLLFIIPSQNFSTMIEKAPPIISTPLEIVRAILSMPGVRTIWDGLGKIGEGFKMLYITILKASGFPIAVVVAFVPSIIVGFLVYLLFKNITFFLVLLMILIALGLIFSAISY